MIKDLLSVAGLCTAFVAAPAFAQDARPAGDNEPSVFDGDWLSVGIGVGYGPSYDGSDDYVAYPIPAIQGQLGGIGIRPRTRGIALDLIPDSGKKVSLDFGPAISLRTNRAGQIGDKVVRSLGKLDKAAEIGPSAGVTVSRVLNPYDSLSFSADVAWDVAGAHKGMVVTPSISYFTPVSRGALVSVNFDAEYAGNRFADYYYSVSPAQSAISGLSPFEARKGFTKAGVTVISAIDLDGDLLNGGFAIVAGGGYARMLGDAKDSPFTSERGSPNQWMGAVGVGYTF